IRRQSYLMHSSMKFMLVSVFPDYGCSNSTCNLPSKNDIAVQIDRQDRHDIINVEIEMFLCHNDTSNTKAPGTAIPGAFSLWRSTGTRRG
ncbi:hypothetical protein, partial [Megasphaera elsdenii]|uniref:hypothetical protein n=1 Tax=Megasphaera elsdenii TaxID=907 RepID=UPI002E790FFE